MINKKNQFRILQIAAACVFAGRAYQHLFWDAPYREIFWDPDIMQGLVRVFTNLSWEDYVTHPDGDIWFQRIVIGQGVFYLVCAIVTIFIKKLPSWFRYLLVLGAMDLIFLALIYLKDKFYHLGQFFEYSLQFGAPLFLFFYLKKEILTPRLIFWMKVAIALTFTCHGLYAIGYYPRPGTFMTMTNRILGLDALEIVRFLFVAGILDFVVAVGIFFKGRLSKIALGYAVLWGFLTSIARVWGNFYFDFPLDSLHQWTHEMVYRFPHFLIPLLLYKWSDSKHNL